jgi:hypothetical protein
VVHEALLVYHSAFFRAALTGRFREAKTKTVRLEEDDPDVFEFFLHWLYYKQLPSCDKADDKDLVARWMEENSYYRYLQLHIFADKYQVKKLERTTLDAVFVTISAIGSLLPNYNTIELAFDSLQPDSNMCRMLVDLYCYWEDYEYTEKYDEPFHTMFLKRVWRRYAMLVQKNNKPGTCTFSYTLDICDYHNHANKDEKNSCKAEQVKMDKSKAVEKKFSLTSS